MYRSYVSHLIVVLAVAVFCAQPAAAQDLCSLIPNVARFMKIDFARKATDPLLKACDECLRGIRPGEPNRLEAYLFYFRSVADAEPAFMQVSRGLPDNHQFGERAGVWLSPKSQNDSVAFIRGTYVVAVTGQYSFKSQGVPLAKAIDDAIRSAPPRSCSGAVTSSGKPDPAKPEAPTPQAAELTEPPAWLKELNPAPYGFSWTKGTRIRAYSITVSTATVSTAKRNMRSGWITGNSIPPVDMPPGGTVTVTLTSRPETGADITKTYSFKVLAEASLSDR